MSAQAFMNTTMMEEIVADLKLDLANEREKTAALLHVAKANLETLERWGHERSEAAHALRMAIARAES